MPSPRLYTLEEANAKVPSLQQKFTEIATLVDRARAVSDQADDLEVVWGSKVLDASCPDREDYLRFKGEVQDKEEAVDTLLKSVTADGIEVKDVQTGLVDFYARRGSEVVYLCWKRDEKAIGFWHTLQGGFAGRKPMEEF